MAGICAVEERRNSQRINVLIDVVLRIPGRSQYFGHARNLSTRGVYVDLHEGVYPDLNAQVISLFRLWDGEHTYEREVWGQVQRSSKMGVAVAFEREDRRVDSLVDDVANLQNQERRTKPR